MVETFDKKKVYKVFRNVQKHQLIEQLIRQFSTNKEDIREKSLSQCDLSSSRNILELGCAFGSFTEALKGRLHPAATIQGLDIVPEYKPFFLDACTSAGYKGKFSAAGIDQIEKFSGNSFDLVICSFALYFFAEMIPQIARILKNGGKFITITHYKSNMKELIGIAKRIMKQNGLLVPEGMLPVELIVSQFSAEKGSDLLCQSFACVREIDFKNSLVFPSQEINFFTEYLYFKSPFFLIGTNTGMSEIINQLLSELKNIADNDNVITMNKDDRIFICSTPRSAEQCK